jgi:hypothetical protein
MGDVHGYELGDSSNRRGHWSKFVKVIQRQTQAALMKSLT